jgi:hypothetical protein
MSAAGRPPAPIRKIEMDDKTQNDEKRLPAVVGDGYDDNGDADDRLIQGTIIRCVDGHWSAKDGTMLSSDLRLVALSTAAALQRWKDRKPIETLIKALGKPLPDLEALNAKIPKTEWEMGLGGVKRAPWVRQHIVYLLNPLNASIFTFINSTAGAALAVSRLKDRVKMMRLLRGNRVVPIVKLDTKPMPTQFGMKVRPEFTINEWRDLGGGTPVEAAKSVQLIAHAGNEVAPVTSEEAFNDSISF